MLTFDPGPHKYFWKGSEVPSVTAILSPLTDLSCVDPDVLRRAQDFGTAVHYACELWDLGNLDVAALDPELFPYLAGWRKFCADHNCKWSKIEEQVFHHGLRYAGTLDRLGMVDSYPSVVDIKTSTSLYPSVGPQLSAYAHAATPVPAAYARYAVRLYPDGYELKRYTSPLDWPTFASLVTLRQFCRNHNITMKEVSHA